VTDLEVTPGYFSPNGDGVNETVEARFTPIAAAGSVSVDVSVARVSDGFLMATLVAGETRPTGVEIREPWTPGPIADGRYRFDVVVTEGAVSDSASAEVEADSTPPQVTWGVVGPSPFDPVDAPLALEVRVVSDATTTTHVIVRQDDAVVDSLGTVAGADTVTLSWGGRRADSTQAPGGRYELFALARDLATNADSTVRDVTLDRLPPAIRVDQPDTVQTDAFPVTLTGRATDGDEVSLVEASFDSAQTFVTADSLTAPADTVGFGVVVDDPAPAPGRRRVVLRARDRYGHTAQRNVVVAYDLLLPAVTSTDLLTPQGAVRDGDSLVVATVWNQPGLTVTADFGNLDTGYADGDEAVADEGGGLYTVRYAVSPSNGRRSGAKNVIVRASTGVLAATDTLSIELVDSQGGDLVAINRNRFDPLAGETVQIAANGTQPVEVDVYGLDGCRVRLLIGDGHVEWDGRNEDGGDVASGVYLLRVRSGDEEEVRRVAVLRGGSR
jgi:hypothetical protein